MKDSHETQLSATCLLLSVAEADEILEKQELETIHDILKDFFSIADNTEDSNNYLLQAITICYKKIDGLPISRSERPFIAWWGGMGLMGHLLKIFTLSLLLFKS